MLTSWSSALIEFCSPFLSLKFYLPRGGTPYHFHMKNIKCLIAHQTFKHTVYYSQNKHFHFICTLNFLKQSCSTYCFRCVLKTHIVGRILIWPQDIFSLVYMSCIWSWGLWVNSRHFVLSKTSMETFGPHLPIHLTPCAIISKATEVWWVILAIQPQWNNGSNRTWWHFYMLML